jgi:hypothetical protein
MPNALQGAWKESQSPHHVAVFYVSTTAEPNYLHYDIDYSISLEF